MAMRDLKSKQGICKLEKAGDLNLCVYACAAAGRIMKDGRDRIKNNHDFIAAAKRLYSKVHDGEKLKPGESCEKVPIEFSIDPAKHTYVL